MGLGKHRWALAAGAVSLGAAGFGAWSHRDALSAAYRVFRDPALLSPQASTAGGPLDLACDVSMELPDVLDRQLAEDFVALEEIDLNDPADAVLATLTPTDLPATITKRTLRWVRFFAEDRRGREAFEVRYRRAGKHRAAIEHELREAGLPEDLVWVAAIESAFDPQATSPAGAAGIWQFMPETATLYGLEIDPWVDERRSLTRATSAASVHLRDLFERLGSWELALAAYNMGYGGVRQAMLKLVELRAERGEKPGPITVAHLAQNRLLPRETADYVPKITAMAIIAANLARFKLDHVVADAAVRSARLTVPEGTRLQTIARAAGMSTNDLRDYNPQLLQGRVPPTGGDYEITLPGDRLAPARSALPAYLDHEILELQNTVPLPTMPERMELGRAAPVLTAVSAGIERPGHLGPNRLPSFPLPGLSADGAKSSGLPIAALGDSLRTDLPSGLSFIESGYKRPSDPLGLLGGDSPGRPTEHERADSLQVDPRLARQLTFLDSVPRALPGKVPFREVDLPGGVKLRMRTDTAAPRVAVNLRIGGDRPVDLDLGQKVRASEHELAFSEVVERSHLDVAVSLAVARLGVLLGQAGPGPLGALRHHLNRHRRAALRRQPYGKAYLTLSERLFPAGHASFGRVITPREPDHAQVGDRLLLSSLPEVLRPGGAVLEVVGDFDEARAQALAEQAMKDLGVLDGLSRVEVGDEPPSSRRVTVEDSVRDIRLLYGWPCPEPGTLEHAAAQVSVEILAGLKKSLFIRELVERNIAVEVKAVLDLDWDAGAVAFEITPTATEEPARLAERIDAFLGRLADDGPTTLELAYAKGMVAYRLKKRIKEASDKPGTDTATLRSRLVHALRPEHTGRLLANVERLGPDHIKRVMKSHLAADKRVVVITVPQGQTLPQN